MRIEPRQRDLERQLPRIGVGDPVEPREQLDGETPRLRAEAGGAEHADDGRAQQVVLDDV